MGNLEKVCRLCFKTSNNIEAKQGITKEVFDVLLPKTFQNLAINDDPETCTYCAENVTKCFDFKSTCLSTQECIRPFYDNKDNKKVDLKNLIYPSESKDATSIVGITEDYDVCGFCMGLINDCSFISLGCENEDLTLEKIMLEKCLPELDLSIIKKPVICASCYGSLHNYFSFVTTLEENMARHCEVADVNTEAPIQVNDFVQFTSQNIVESKENKYRLIKIEDIVDEEAVECSNELVKMEYRNFNNISQITEENKLTCDKVIIKVKEEIDGEGQYSIEGFDCDGKCFTKMEVQEFNVHVTTDMSTCKKAELKEDNFMETDTQELSCSNEEIEIKPDQVDFDSFQELLVEYKTTDDPLEISTVEARPKKQHVSTLKSSSEVLRAFKCEMCSYETKRERHLKRHLLTHKSPTYVNMFECEMCSFTTKRKCHLKDHLLTHKSPAEVTVFKCEMCAYETKRKRNLKQHSLTHKSPSDTNIFKCEMCSFSTKRKESLNYHLLTHKSASEVKMFKCKLCLYQTKLKRYLKRHFLTHKSPSDINVFQCETCSFDTKSKDCFKDHLLTHKSPSVVNIFECEICSFNTERKDLLKDHLLTHKSPAEVKMFKCEMCAYETKRKRNLKQHSLSHKSPSDLNVFKCEICSYNTKRKEYLNYHLLTHKSSSEVTMFQCEFCSHQTKRKHHLKVHLLTHRSSLEATMFKCELCSYEAKRKYHLKRHLLTHKSPYI